MAPSEGVRLRSQYIHESCQTDRHRHRRAARRSGCDARLPELERCSEADAPLVLGIVASSTGCGGGRMARPAAAPPWPRPLPRFGCGATTPEGREATKVAAKT